MVKSIKGTKEQEKYRSIRHYFPIRRISPPEHFVAKKDKYYPLFNYLYKKTRKLYFELPPRKNGEDLFLHPLNLVNSLKKAKVQDILIYCVALTHDYVEEMVSLYEKKNKVELDKKGIKRLDDYEEKVFQDLENDLKEFCKKEKIKGNATYIIIQTLRVLTRHKRHYYFKSLSAIFNCKDQDIKLRAIQVKLADATHNLHCIESFDEETRLYTSFKSLFILNNAKKFLIDKFGEDLFKSNDFPPTRRLFSKCCKATFDALLRICIMNKSKGIIDILYILQLAFKKYVYIKSGLLQVTDLNRREIHPMKLYQGVILKYDHRLHQEWKQYERRKLMELEYCKRFFSDLDYSKVQFQAIMDYKDAYATREVIARLLYQPDFYISRFICSELSRKGRIKRSIV